MIQDPLIELGQKIKARREELGLTHEDISVSSRVSVKYIKAIEEADRTNLPEEIYLTGFVSLILKTLKLNNDLIEDYKDKETHHVIQAILEDNPVEMPEKDVNQKSRIAKLESLKDATDSTRKYFKLYQLYIFAFVIILSFGFIVIKKVAQDKEIEAMTAGPPRPKVENNIVKNKKAEAEKEEKAREADDKKIKEEAKKYERKHEEKSKKEEPKTEQKLVTEPKEAKKKESEEAHLKINVVDVAWVQIVGIDKKKVLFEGDVFPNAQPNSFDLKDKIGFVLATGNAGAFMVDTGNGFKALGEKGQLIKWYYPESTRQSHRISPIAQKKETPKKELIKKEEKPVTETIETEQVELTDDKKEELESNQLAATL